MKKKALILAAALCVALAGCGKTTQVATDELVDVSTAADAGTSEESSAADGGEADNNAADTVAGKLVKCFNEVMQSETDIVKAADTLCKEPVFGDIAMANMEVTEGLLNGFDGEIKGFKKGVVFSPMIGSMPFVGYIFETDAPDDLIKQLEEKHMLNWNICTTADEMKTAKSGNYVLFVMAPKSFEQ